MCGASVWKAVHMLSSNAWLMRSRLGSGVGLRTVNLHAGAAQYASPAGLHSVRVHGTEADHTSGARIRNGGASEHVHVHVHGSA